MTTTEAVKILKQAVALLMSNHPQKVEGAIQAITKVIEGLQARKHK